MNSCVELEHNILKMSWESVIDHFNPILYFWLSTVDISRVDIDISLFMIQIHP